MGFPCGSVVKNPPANAGDTGSTPGSGRSPGEGNGNPLQYSCLENPMDRGACWATVHGVAESDTTERLHFMTLVSKLLYSKGTLRQVLLVTVKKKQQPKYPSAGDFLKGTFIKLRFWKLS